MKNLTFFTGAGISKESGIDTFRDSGGLWTTHTIDDIATLNGWRKNRELVLDFYNERRKQLATVEPNQAHLDLVRLEEKFNVNIVTQNIDNLHSRAGSTNIIHLHGELTKAYGSLYNGRTSNDIEKTDIGYNEIKIGDKCEFTGSQLRPDVVWFGEYPNNTDKASEVFMNTDILVIIGTSMSIDYTIDLLKMSKRNPDLKIFCIDPNPPKEMLLRRFKNIIFIEKPATEGVRELINILSFYN